MSSQPPGCLRLWGDLIMEHTDLEGVSTSAELWLRLVSLELGRCRSQKPKHGDAVVQTEGLPDWVTVSTVGFRGTWNGFVVILHTLA